MMGDTKESRELFGISNPDLLGLPKWKQAETHVLGVTLKTEALMDEMQEDIQDKAF